MTIEEFVKALPPEGSVLGLDLGAKTIGLAISDAKRGLAVPLKTIVRTKLSKDIQALEKIIAERGITGLVIGLPLNMDGTEGPRAQSTRTFASNLLKRIGLPLVFSDERLSTHEAKLALKEANISRDKGKGKVDASAAAIILQGALDRLKLHEKAK